jgi:CubicO group peptidase (beta-lactamase class C family)
LLAHDYLKKLSERTTSGTKSFSCAIAVAAVDDGLLKLDERVADTITT